MQKLNPKDAEKKTGKGKIPIEILFDEEESKLLGFAFGIVNQKQIAEELVQEAFSRLHQNWSDIEKPRPWLYRALRNLCISWLRRNHRKKSIENEFGESTTKEIEEPDENLLALERVGLVHKNLSELEEEDQYIIKLKYFKSLSYKEIADITGLSISNVGYRLHHIIKKLSNSLRRSGF